MVPWARSWKQCIRTAGALRNMELAPLPPVRGPLTRSMGHPQFMSTKSTEQVSSMSWQVRAMASG